MIESASCPIFFALRLLFILPVVTCHLFQIDINSINSEQYVRRIWPVVFFLFLSLVISVHYRIPKAMTVTVT